jgi:VPDSG-CTERM motif
MNSITKLALTALAGVCSALTAEAVTINITPATNPQWTGTNNSNLSAGAIDAFLLAQGRDVNGTLTEAYKQNVGGSESGDFASSYTTTFNNTPSDPADAFIDYVSGPSIFGGEIYLYVKDGNHQPAFYLFDISSWNGTDDLSLRGFWPGGGAISHLTILTTGGNPPPPSVPDSGATLVMLGMAVSSIGMLRRKFVS